MKAPFCSTGMRTGRLCGERLLVFVLVVLRLWAVRAGINLLVVMVARGIILPPCFGSLPWLEGCVLIFHRNDPVIPLLVTGSNSLAIQPRGGGLLRLEDQLLQLDAVHNVDNSTRSVFGHELRLWGAKVSRHRHPELPRSTVPKNRCTSLQIGCLTCHQSLAI